MEEISQKEALFTKLQTRCNKLSCITSKEIEHKDIDQLYEGWQTLQRETQDLFDLRLPLLNQCKDFCTGMSCSNNLLAQTSRNIDLTHHTLTDDKLLTLKVCTCNTNSLSLRSYHIGFLIFISQAFESCCYTYVYLNVTFFFF